jgi:hypothetical protein
MAIIVVVGQGAAILQYLNLHEAYMTGVKIRIVSKRVRSRADGGWRL